MSPAQSLACKSPGDSHTSVTSTSNSTSRSKLAGDSVADSHPDTDDFTAVAHDPGSAGVDDFDQIAIDTKAEMGEIEA